MRRAVVVIWASTVFGLSVIVAAEWTRYRARRARPSIPAADRRLLHELDEHDRRLLDELDDRPKGDAP